MLRIKNIIAALIFTFALCGANNAVAQDTCRFAAFEFSPIVISAPKPAYPAKAVAVKAQGDVQVDVKIDAHGEVIEAHFVSGHELLRKPVLAAAIKWRFNESPDKADVRHARLTFGFYLKVDDYKESTLEEVKHQYRTRIYWAPAIDCFNDCGNINEQ
ncbi:MAG TPA: TonB family protein [Pyrinomonadaceae bacterium]|jgi:TonB family protein